MSRAATALIPVVSEGLLHSGREQSSLQPQGEVTTMASTGQRTSLGFLPVWENGKGSGAPSANG